MLIFVYNLFFSKGTTEFWRYSVYIFILSERTTDGTDHFTTHCFYEPEVLLMIVKIFHDLFMYITLVALEIHLA
jgi:hypothetical protein